MISIRSDINEKIKRMNTVATTSFFVGKSIGTEKYMIGWDGKVECEDYSIGEKVREAVSFCLRHFAKSPEGIKFDNEFESMAGAEAGFMDELKDLKLHGLFRTVKCRPTFIAGTRNKWMELEITIR